MKILEQFHVQQNQHYKVLRDKFNKRGIRTLHRKYKKIAEGKKDLNN